MTAGGRYSAAGAAALAAAVAEHRAAAATAIASWTGRAAECMLPSACCQWVAAAQSRPQHGAHRSPAAGWCLASLDRLA